MQQIREEIFLQQVGNKLDGVQFRSCPLEEQQEIIGELEEKNRNAMQVASK